MDQRKFMSVFWLGDTTCRNRDGLTADRYRLSAPTSNGLTCPEAEKATRCCFGVCPPRLSHGRLLCVRY
ncbi:hypothetical protein E2C01_017042 [Portunus trituberculatus]|uniref:Uncharacterized protein n=1 Tax=Portunus trituberculatus TaxID=210409 RepID=A0A5B7DSJ7_PORTR|nr:hypothetical protein [Portunus trituberculatus]